MTIFPVQLPAMNRLLKHFQVVARHKKISSACAELKISQPALSKSIKTLEDHFDLALFERLPRGMELTQAGERLLSRVRRMNMEYQYAVEELDQLKTGRASKLSIGAGSVWEQYLTPVIMQLYEEFPDIEVVIRLDTNEQLMPDLEAGKLDIVLGGGAHQLAGSEQLVFIPLFEVSMQIAAHRSHPLAFEPHVTVEQLSQYPWAAYQRSKGAFLEHLFHRQGVKSVRYSLQTELLSVAIAFMKQRQALLCIPEQFLDHMPKGEIIKIPFNEPIWNFHSGVWYQASSRYTPPVDRFIQLLVERYSESSVEPL